MQVNCLGVAFPQVLDFLGVQHCVTIKVGTDTDSVSEMLADHNSGRSSLHGITREGETGSSCLWIFCLL